MEKKSKTLLFKDVDQITEASAKEAVYQYLAFPLQGICRSNKIVERNEKHLI